MQRAKGGLVRLVGAVLALALVAGGCGPGLRTHGEDVQAPGAGDEGGGGGGGGDGDGETDGDSGDDGTGSGNGDAGTGSGDAGTGSGSGDVGTGTGSGDAGTGTGSGDAGSSDAGTGGALVEPSISELELHYVAFDSDALQLEVVGTGFRASSQVTVNGALKPAVLASVQRLVVQVGTPALGTLLSVRVVNPVQEGGSSDARALSVSAPTPVLENLTPSIVDVQCCAAAAGPTVRVRGRDFRAGSSALVDGAVRTTRVLSGEELDLDLRPEDVEAGGRLLGVTVTNAPPGGPRSNTGTLLLRNPAPQGFALVHALLPTSRPAVLADGGVSAAEGLPVAFSATGVNRSTRLRFRGMDLPVEPTDAAGTAGVAHLPAASGASVSGAEDVVLVNPTPGGGTSNLQQLTLVARTALVRVTPGVLPAGAGDAALVVEGVGQEDVEGTPPVVEWDGAALATVREASGVLRATVPAALLDAPREAGVRVRRGDGALTPRAAVQVAEAPAPVVRALAPGVVGAGSGVLTLRVQGGGFTPASRVRWGAARLELPTRFVDEGLLEATVAPELLVQAADVEVDAWTPPPGGGAAAPAVLVVGAHVPMPVALGLSPMSARAGDAGLWLEVEGRGFLTRSEVLWNGAPLQLEAAGAQRLRAWVPPALLAAEGRAEVAVRTPDPDGSTGPALSFTVHPAASSGALTGAWPAALDVGSFTQVELSGRDFTPATRVRWNDLDLTPTLLSATRLRVGLSAKRLTAGTSAPVRVVSDGGVPSEPLHLDVRAVGAPRVDGLVPGVVSVGDATAAAAPQVRFTGSTMDPPLVLLRTGHTACEACLAWDELPGTPPWWTLAPQETAQAGVVHVQLALEEGATPSPPVALRVHAARPVPVLRSLAPASTAVGWATRVRVEGTGLSPDSTVAVDGVAVPTQWLPDGSLLATLAPAQVAEARSARLTVTTPAPGGGTSAPLLLQVRAQP